jgi:surface protein
MFSMFADASSFDQDLGNWDLSSVSSMENMFENVTLSTSNYDATLMGWATDTSPSSTDENDDVPIGMNFHGGNSKYCAIDAWNLLTKTSGNGGYNWTIEDGNLDPTCGETYFITTWNLSDLSDLSITIPTATGETYNYEVDWNHDPANGFNSGGTYTGDATSPSNQYAATGEYKVAIRGDFPRIFFGGGSGEHKIIDINQWGENSWTSMFGAFTGCENIDVTAQDTPDLSNADNMQFMFAYCTNFDGSTANWNWEVSTITNMSRVFQETTFIGNASISNWNTSNVLRMVHMFKATGFNINIGNWDLSSMLPFQMDGMFEDVTLSTAVYDAILIGWATDSTVPGDGIDDIPVNTGFHGGNSRYCAAKDAWNTLNTDNSWNIIDGGGCSDSDLFITTWSVEENGTITIPTTGTGYDYVIDWNYNGTSFNGDGITYTDGDTATSPSYSAGGTYEIAIYGNFPRIYFNNQGDNDKITEIKQWGTGVWSSMENAFKGCYNLQLTATDSPDLSLVSSTNSMFYGCQTLTGHDSMNDWEMSTIFSMREMFTIATNFNANISSWDVSNVSDMFGLFLVASTFDQDISGWNVGNVTNMDNMFSSAGSFNKNIGGWNVAKVETMENMFYSATAFNQEIGVWNVGLVENMRSMFYNASDFDGDISNWNVENVLVMDTMFRNATSFNQDLGGWDVSSVTNMYEMFAGATAFDQNIGAWDISSLNTANGSLGANGMFNGVELSVDNYDALLIGWSTLDTPGGETQIPTNITFSGGDSFYCEGAAARALLIADYGWTIATDDTYLPAYCGPEEDKFKTTWVVNDTDKSVRIPTTGTGYNYIVNWGDGNTTINHNGDASHNYENAGTYQISISGDFPRIFFEDALSNNDKKITSIDQWGAQVWSSMESAFSYCTNLEMNATDVPNLSQVESMDEMFRECSTALFNPSIGSWDVSNVTSMRRLFIDAYLFDQDINAWNVGNVTNMSYMFNNAQLFNKPLNNWDVSSVTNMEGMFFNAEIFDQDLGDWDISMLSNASRMFEEIALSVENYDALLIGWSTLNTSEGETQIPTGVQFNGGNSIHCDGAAARGILSDPPYNWGISDSGVCGFFATTWKTTEANESITIYTSSTDLPSLPDVLEGPFVYDYNINWGDGQVDLNVTGNISHTYLTAGDHKVRIEGVFPHMSAGNGGEAISNAAKLKSIDVWGDLEWKSMAYSFTYCSNMELNASDSPDVSQVTNMSAAFGLCYEITDPDLSGWDVSNVENMRYTFIEAVLFTGDVTQWDVSSVTDMTFMFSDALQFNGDINGWNVSNVIIMEGMFSDANTFNRDLNDWDVTSVKNMEFMFNGETHFNGNISSWDVSGVTSMFGMFSGNEGFNQNIGSWDIRNVDNISYMFDGATEFDQNLATWDLSNVLTAENMFTDSGMSVANYDDTLIGWATDSSPLTDDDIDDIPSNVRLDATVAYCLSASERQNLISIYGWTINDGDLDPNCNANDIVVSPKVFLQGAALNPNVGEETLMRDDLRVGNHIPTISPYSDKLTCASTVFDVTGDAAIIDWILVELRDETDDTIVIDSQSALLQRDGDVVGVDGVSALKFFKESKNYYIVMSHRNHISIRSAASISLSTSNTIINFSNDTAIVSGGLNAMISMNNGVYAMPSGDYDGNGQIQNTDTNAVISTLGASGYHKADMDMNGQIQNSDINNIINRNVGKGQQF